jgi:putative NADH-flavin reductase
VSRILVVGAGGRAGRAAVAEARRRGRHVTAAVRSPDRHPDLVADEVRVVPGDAGDAGQIADAAIGHEAAIVTIFDSVAMDGSFYAHAAAALIDGLASSGVTRMVWVGLASALENSDGVPLMDAPDYPAQYRTFALGHATAVDVLRAAPPTLDWAVLSPAGDFDHDGARTGRYQRSPADGSSRISYPDFAIALLDEIERPTVHRRHIGVQSP